MLSSGADFGFLNSYQINVNNAQQRVQNEFGGGVNNCVSLDLLIKKVTDKLVSESKKPKQDKFYISALADFKQAMEFSFIQNRCSEKIEKSKQIESAVLLTQQAIKSEESINTKGSSEQKIYIASGALILLVGLYIILKK